MPSALPSAKSKPPSAESRAAALACLLLAFATLALGIVIVIQQFPRGLAVLGCIGLGLIAAWGSISGGSVRGYVGGFDSGMDAR